jgi:hypothetical protein
MFNVLRNRLQSGVKQDVITPIPQFTRNDERDGSAVEPSPPVSAEELRSELKKSLMPEPAIVQKDLPSGQSIELVHFANLIEFVFWYENNSSLFSEKQRVPLNTLIEAKNITLGGCNCDVDKRRFIAEDYFKKFWIQNKHTDLLPTLQNIFKAKKIMFGDFLVFPE